MQRCRCGACSATSHRRSHEFRITAAQCARRGLGWLGKAGPGDIECCRGSLELAKQEGVGEEHFPRGMGSKGASEA
ncbi:hypothetical protein NDU88_010227 [Pleurodeles waltl]|uniref:Uncharacterized protein n=1 Tax=Pleurodeles waltl TaxID=8319 RepID=A0AAV7QVA3_PLEWA|nr:hypothetical protein NDU88_010227 [Pleurodeles waltl]